MVGDGKHLNIVQMKEYKVTHILYSQIHRRLLFQVSTEN